MSADPVAVEVERLVSDLGIDANVDRIEEILRTGARLGLDRTDRLDLKITASALAEMRAAFRMFAPFADRPKVTIFGSARTRSDDPLYLQTREVAAALAEQGWMVVTGAGPGIMQAAMEGAGKEASIGVSIRLPFEQRANDVIHDDPKHVSMKYFFTRKLMLVKESRGFVAVPGGFGTLDETLELLTLQQTGKAEPTPIVLLDIPGGTYWQHFATFVRDELAARSMVAADDLDRVLITDSVEEAVQEILGFWSTYHSLRWVGSDLVLRLRRPLPPAAVEELNRRFAALLVDGPLVASGPLGPERDGNDHVELPRLVVPWVQRNVGQLHRVIRAINELDA
ncbi:MAG: TIGR00730 family Rossman fold protein [Acidimicrobiales bacterium]